MKDIIDGVVLGKTPLCCSVKPEHGCIDCSYRRCEECGQKLMDKSSRLNKDYNMLHDDHVAYGCDKARDINSGVFEFATLAKRRAKRDKRK